MACLYLKLSYSTRMVTRALWFVVTFILDTNAEFLDSYWNEVTTVPSVALEETFKLHSTNTMVCLLRCNEMIGCQVVIMETGTDTCFGYSYASNNTSSLTVSGNIFCRNERCDAFGYTCSMSFNTCYKLHTEKSTWTNAKQSCENEGATLFIMKTSLQFQLLTEIGSTLDPGVLFWVGANDIDTEGSWIWLNGNSLSNSYWLPGDPNGAQFGEDCIGFLDTGLVDATCTDAHHYLCQK